MKSCRESVLETVVKSQSSQPGNSPPNNAAGLSYAKKASNEPPYAYHVPRKTYRCDLQPRLSVLLFPFQRRVSIQVVNFGWTTSCMESYIRQLIQSQKTDQIVVAWQGGEPTLMGWDFYNRVIRIEKITKSPGLKF